jgi:predicted naringenin-chalcone synthase
LPAYLHSLETVVPVHSHSQEDLSTFLQDRLPDPRFRRLAAQAFRQSGIETRHAVVEGFFGHAPFDLEGRATTSARNAVYATESRLLAVALGEKILSLPGAIPREEITHVIFATCTGFVNPGPDYFLVRDLGLRESVERYTLGFMGCYAAFPALRMAAQFCEANPKARVLVVCLELCSLHMQIDESPDSILGNTVFADGAAAALVTSIPPTTHRHYRLDGFASATIPEGESAMAWSIGDRGFDLVLSGYVPKILSAELGGLFARLGLRPADFDRFAVHPGGKSILDRFIAALDLPDDSLDASREILRENGNMSSATILFVLKRLLETASADESVLATAFGPGLTVETARLTVQS